MNVLSGLGRIGTFQTAVRTVVEVGAESPHWSPWDSQLLQPWGPQPKRRERLPTQTLAGWLYNELPGVTYAPPPPRGSLWVLETVAMAEGRQFPFLAAEGAQPPRWEKLGFPVTRVTTKRCNLHTGDTTNALIRKYGKWMRSRMMQNKSNPAKTKH